MCAKFISFFSRASSTTELLRLSFSVNLSQIRAGRERSRGGSELFPRRAFYNIYIQRFFPFSCVLKTLPVPQRTPELPQLSQLATTHFPAYREERSCGSSELFCMRSCLFTHVTIHSSDCSGRSSPKIPSFSEKRAVPKDSIYTGARSTIFAPHQPLFQLHRGGGELDWRFHSTISRELTSPRWTRQLRP